MIAFKTGDLVTGILRRDWLGEILEIEADAGGDDVRLLVRWLKPPDVWPNPRLEIDGFLVPASETGPGANLREVC
jgi:hypothetical protein